MLKKELKDQVSFNLRDIEKSLTALELVLDRNEHIEEIQDSI